MSSKLTNFIQRLAVEPELLRRGAMEVASMKQKLHKQGAEASQGTGNQVTDQEASFALSLEEAGWVYASDARPPGADGDYYIYQVNGTQRSIDFQVFQMAGGIKRRAVNFDLKHTKTDIFFLNDGWFREDVIYIVSWMRRLSEPRKKKILSPSTFIALGQEIPTKEEQTLYDELCEIKRKYNTDYKGAGSFHCYIRFANTYRCDRFTTEYSMMALTSVLKFVAPPKRPAVAPLTEQ